MNNYAQRIAVIAAVSMLAASTTASAQVTHMNGRTKAAYFQVFTKAAKQKVAEGKKGQAKLICLSAFYLIKNQLRIPRWPQRNMQLIKDYDAVCEPVYKGHAGDPAGGAAIVARYKDKITEYGHALAFAPFGRARTDATGYLAPYERYKRIVMAPLIFDEALKHAVEFVEKLPNMKTLLTTNVPGFQKLLPRLLEITTGKFAGTPLVKKKAIPGITTEVDKMVKAFRPSWHPDRMTQEATKMGKWIMLLEKADPAHPNIARYRAEIAKMKVAVDKRWKAFMAKQRMPKSKYVGKNKSAVIAAARAAYSRRYPKEKILRIVIAADDWGPARGRGWWKGNAWHWSVFSRLSPVVVAVEQRIKGKKKYRMFRMTLARERKGRGWTKPYMAGNTDYGRPILKKNIFK